MTIVRYGILNRDIQEAVEDTEIFIDLEYELDVTVSGSTIYEGAADDTIGTMQEP